MSDPHLHPSRSKVPQAPFKSKRKSTERLGAHDLSAWCQRFMAAIGKLRAKNPFRKLVLPGNGLHPAFLVCALYWYRVPSKTRIEQDSEKARALAKKWATLAGRISRDADEVRSTLGTSFRDPYGYQLREIFLQTQLAQEGSLKTSLAADCMTEYARKLEQAAKTIKDRASRKRVLRTNWEVLIWCHLQATVGKELSRRYLPALIECADQAFGSERLPDKSFRGIIQNCERYKAESPTAYARHNNRALKNAALGRYLTPEHIFSAFRVPRAAKCWQREQLLCRNTEILGISEALLDHLIATERLLPVRIGKRVLLSWSGLRRFANGLVEDGDPEAAAQDALA